MTDSENIRVRIEKVIKYNRLTMTDELKLLETLVMKYNRVLKKVGKSQPYISKLVSQGKLMNIKLANKF